MRARHAIHSINAKKWVICATRRRQAGNDRATGSTLGPSVAKRRSASLARQARHGAILAVSGCLLAPLRAGAAAPPR